LVDASHPRPQQQLFRIASPERFCSHPVLSGTMKKRESIVPETIKKRLESYPGWSDLVRRRKKTPPLFNDTDKTAYDPASVPRLSSSNSY